MAIINCPECGREVSDSAITCIYCGYPLNKTSSSQGQDVVDNNSKKNSKKLKFLLVITVIGIAVCLAVFLYFKFVYRGTFEVNLGKDTFELGSTVNLLNCLEYDPENIIDINVTNDDNFNADKIGDYTVTFSVKNKRGYIEDVTFDFHVIDTVAPELSVKNDTIYIAKGNEYDLKDNVQVIDKDDCTVEISGDYDFNKEGTYNISFTARDGSGNISEKQDMTLIVENRDDCVVRNAKFGDSAEIIKRYESCDIYEEGVDSDGSYYITYQDVVEGEDTNIFYNLNDNDELSVIVFYFTGQHTDYSLYISKYNTLYEKLTDKYGKPEGGKQTDRLYKYCESEEEALSLGLISYDGVWETDDMTVTMYLGNDNYEILFFILYQSKVYELTDNSGV